MAQNDAITNQVTKISLAGKTLSLLTSGTAKGRDKIGLSESFLSENLLDSRTIARLCLKYLVKSLANVVSNTANLITVVSLILVRSF